MKKLQCFLLISAFILGISAVPVSAVTIDFESVPQSQWNDIGNWYSGSGVTFSGAMILNANETPNTTYWLDSTNYPPHSAVQVMSAPYDPYGNAATITGTFASPVKYVSVYYTSDSDLFLEAYDAASNLIAQDSGGANTGSSALLQVSGNNIAYVSIHDAGGFYTADDLTFSVPEPGILPLLGLALSLLGMVGIRKKFNR
jgi:hypothetical protein